MICLSNNEVEKRSELVEQTEETKDKLLQILLNPEQFAQFMDIQTWYRSPSYTHTFKLMIEDVIKGMGTGEWQKIVRGE